VRRSGPSTERLLAWALDPVLFALDCGLPDPDIHQQRILRSEAPQLGILASRQFGKTEYTANVALRTALLAAATLVLVLARAQRQAIELLRRVSTQLAALGGLAPATLTVDNAQSLEFSNASRIVSLPSTEANIRGFSSPALIAIDEAARVPDDLYHAVRPMLAIGRGRVIALTSAWGKFGWFYGAWTEGGAQWERIEVRADQCERFDPAWLAQERAALGERIFRREYLCEFGDVDESVFAADLVDRAFDNDLEPVFPGGVFGR